MTARLTTVTIVSLMALTTIFIGCGRQPSMSAPKMKLDEAVGIETLGGVFTPLISREAELPTSIAEDFSTASDNQDAVQVTFLAGASTNDARLLGMFIIDQIQPAPRGIPRIRVTVSVDGDGAVRVEARNSQTGVTKSSSLGKVKTRRM